MENDNFDIGLVDKHEIRKMVAHEDEGKITWRSGSLLHLAAAVDDIDLVRLLLERGEDPLKKNDAGRTPLMIAEELGHQEIVRVMREWADRA